MKEVPPLLIVVAEVFWVDARMPIEVRRAITPLLKKHACLVPGWCNHVDVFWKDKDEDEGAAAIESFYDYRRATLWLYPNFVTRPDRRENTVVHELMHLLTEPWYQAVGNLKRFLNEHHPESKQLLIEELRHAMEQTTCDLADAFLGTKRVAALPATTLGGSMGKGRTRPSSGFRKSAAKGASKPSGGPPRATPSASKVVKGARVKK